MTLPALVFLEQIIDNIAVFECIRNTDVDTTEQNEVIRIIVNKENVSSLNVGYYYNLKCSVNNAITPYKIVYNTITPYEFIYGCYDNENNVHSFSEIIYVVLELNIAETVSQRNQIAHNYQEIYLFSSFFSNVFFHHANHDVSIWDNFLDVVKHHIMAGTVKNIKKLESELYKNYKNWINWLSSLENNEKLVWILQQKETDLNQKFNLLLEERNIGTFYASLILHAVFREKAMIYNDEVYRFLKDRHILNKSSIKEEYGEYSDFLCKKITLFCINNGVDKPQNEVQSGGSEYICNFDYVKFLHEVSLQ